VDNFGEVSEGDRVPGQPDVPLAPVARSRG
jgi:hypothetical protein